jgi:hypothetical protein
MTQHNHERPNMPSPISEHPVFPMTVEAATDYARYLVEHEAKGLSDVDGALDRLEQRYGIGRWTLEHLRKGKAKSCDVGLFARLRAAYLDLCQRQLTKLERQIAIEKATGDDPLEDLDRKVRELAQELAEAKARLHAKETVTAGSALRKEAAE